MRNRKSAMKKANPEVRANKRNPSGDIGSKPVGSKTKPVVSRGRTGGKLPTDKGKATQPGGPSPMPTFKEGGKACGGKVKKYAKGGKVRGTGCATKGTNFSGTY